MKPLDRIAVSLRHIRSRLVESLLVIVATAVGVALVAAMVAFVGAYSAQTEALLNHPAYREVIVEVVGSESDLTEPAVPYDAETTSEINLGAEDLERALAATSALEYGYLADTTRFSTRVPGVGGTRSGFEGGGGAPAGRIPGGQASSGRTGGERPALDLESFFEADPDVITELPLDTFGGALVTSDFFDAYGLAAAQGSLFTDEDVEVGNQVIVLGASLAGKLFPERDPLGLKVRLNLRTFTVIGVLEGTDLSDVETGVALDEISFAPNGEAQISFGGQTIRGQRPTRTLRFAVADSALIETAETQLAAHFDTEYGGSTVRVTAPVEAARLERDKLSRVLAVVLFLAGAALFIASINLFNLMLMRVIKRTKHVGISRAIGASQREIFRAFLNESGMMSLLGAAVGLAASPFVYGLLRGSLVTDAGASTADGWLYLVIGALGAFVFSLIFGVWPARQAARIDASLAIRTE